MAEIRTLKHKKHWFPRTPWFHWDWFFTIALAMFIAGCGVTIFGTVLDYGIQVYQSAKFLKFQDDLLKDAPPNSRTKDFHTDSHGKVVPNDPDHSL